MPQPTIKLLSKTDIQAIHDISLKTLRDVGMMVHHTEVLKRLAEAGANVNSDKKIVRFNEDLVMWALEKAGKQFAVRGRDPKKSARFGYGDLNLMSSPGQYSWFDDKTGRRRDPTLADAQAAIKVGDTLSNITVVGAMSVPQDVPPQTFDVILAAEMVQLTGKPTRCWNVNRRSSRYMLEIYAAVAGGKEALKKNPMFVTFLEPISPLQLPETGLDVLLEFLDYGQPVAIGPMAMASGTAPTTLAGTLAQENAEILGGIVTVQLLSPGTPITYGGIPHIMDPRTSICAFGAPEQGLLAIGMAQLGKHYGFPVYVNVNLTDSKLLDAQTGMEKMGSFVLGMLSGADEFGHAGILGTDHGGSLPWLVADNEAMNYAKRIARGFSVDDDSLAGSVVAEIGPAGNFLSHEHTLRHFRDEFWIPGSLWTRDSYDGWVAKGETSFYDRAVSEVKKILDTYEPEPIDPALKRELDKIVETARAELCGS
jgi:trimethylamine--corrinoid protein Co-methyltransferase